jgi:hypothetical protein
MGLWRVLFLTEVYSDPSKSQGFSSSWKFVELEVKFHGVSPAVSGHASSQNESACGCSAAASWRPTLWNSSSSGSRPECHLSANHSDASHRL